MLFSEYIQKLHRCIGKEDSAGFVREVLLQAAGGDEEKFPCSLSDDAYRKLYSGVNGISRQAPAILNAMDTEGFTGFLQDRMDASPGAQQRVADEFGSLVSAPFTPYSVSLMELFYGIILEAATTRRKSPRKKPQAHA